MATTARPPPRRALSHAITDDGLVAVAFGCVFAKLWVVSRAAQGSPARPAGPGSIRPSRGASPADAYGSTPRASVTRRRTVPPARGSPARIEDSAARDTALFADSR